MRAPCTRARVCARALHRSRPLYRFWRHVDPERAILSSAVKTALLRDPSLIPLLMPLDRHYAHGQRRVCRTRALMSLRKTLENQIRVAPEKLEEFFDNTPIVVRLVARSRV